MLARLLFVFTLLFGGLHTVARPAPLPQDQQQPAPAPQDQGQGQDQQQPAPPPQGTDQQQPAPAPPQGEDQQQPAPSPQAQDQASASGSADWPEPSESESEAPTGLTGEISSDIPLSCIAGCSLTQTLYEYVDPTGLQVENCVDDRNSSCTQFCTTANYTRAITCLNCLVVQGSSLSSQQLSVALTGYTNECKRVKGSRFGSVPSLAASATTTESTSTSLGENEYLPTWFAFNLPTDAAIPTDVGQLGSRIGGGSG